MTENPIRTPRVTLRLSQPVCQVMLPDIKAILPASSVDVFINALETAHYATLECWQQEDACALLASVIVVWRQLGHLQHIQYQSGAISREVSDATQFQLFSLLKPPFPLFTLQ